MKKISLTAQSTFVGGTTCSAALGGSVGATVIGALGLAFAPVSAGASFVVAAGIATLIAGATCVGTGFH